MDAPSDTLVSFGKFSNLGLLSFSSPMVTSTWQSPNLKREELYIHNSNKIRITWKFLGNHHMDRLRIQ